MHPGVDRDGVRWVFFTKDRVELGGSIELPEFEIIGTIDGVAS